MSPCGGAESLPPPALRTGAIEGPFVALKKLSFPQEVLVDVPEVWVSDNSEESFWRQVASPLSELDFRRNSNVSSFHVIK